MVTVRFNGNLTKTPTGWGDEANVLQGRTVFTGLALDVIAGEILTTNGESRATPYTL